MDKRKELRQQKLKTFNPNYNGLEAHGIFGLPFTQEDAEHILIPAPWEVTVSYGAGTINGPSAILDASQQIDLHDYHHPDTWKAGYAMLAENLQWHRQSEELRPQAEQIIAAVEAGETPDKKVHKEINDAGKNFAYQLQQEALKWLNDGRIVGLVGGDHSTPLGLMQALAQKHGNFSILQIDAHADLRQAYEGFTFSHASIMYNALQIEQAVQLVQVGIRDMCKEEADYIAANPKRVQTFFDAALKARLHNGENWADICRDIVAPLGQKVYISFDIDGLQPWLCPNTGTPVPGGFVPEEIVTLLNILKESGRTIIGFDLSEVSPKLDDEWDANVGARILYQLCNFTVASNAK